MVASYDKDANFLECKTYGHAYYKLNIAREKTIVVYKKL
jgi:hypothetical protein